MAQIVYQPEIDQDRPVLEQIFPQFETPTSVAVTVINKVTDALVATATGLAAQSAVDSSLYLYDTADITGINLETVAFAQLTLRFRATYPSGGVIDRRQTLVINGAARQLSLTRFQGAVWIDTTPAGAPGTAFPLGTREDPVDNLADAVTIAANWGLSEYRVRGSIALISAHANWFFSSWGGGHSESSVALGGQNVAGSNFKGLILSGIAVGAIGASDCDLDTITVVGEFHSCGIVTGVTLAAGESVFHLCYSETPGGGTPIIDFVGAGRAVNVRAHSGGWDVRNMSDVSNVATFEFIAGQIIFAATCTAGVAEVRGTGKRTDNSAGTTIDFSAYLNKPDITDDVWDEDIDAAHGGSSAAGLLLRVLGSAIATRANNPTLDALLGIADSVGVDLPEQVNTELEVTQGHGAGSWTGSAATVITAIADAVWDEDIVSAHGAASAAGLLLRVLGAAVSTRVNSSTLDALLGMADGPGVTVESRINDVETDTQDIQGRLPAALVAGRMDSDVGNMQAGVIDAAAIATDAIDADALATDALQEIATHLETAGTNPHGTGAWDATAVVPQQDIRDAMKLAPTAGAPAVGSVDEHLDNIETDTAAIDTRLPADPADESNQLAQHAQTQADVAAVQADTDDIQTRLPVALVGGRMDSDVGNMQAGVVSAAAIATDAIDADALAVSGLQEIADHLETAGTNPHGTGAWDGAASNILTVKQNYVYDSTGNRLVGMVWLESGDGQIVTPTSVSVDVRDVDNTLLFTMTDAAPDAAGFFKVVQASPGLATGAVFKAVATMTVPVVGVLTSGYGMFTIG